jgi:cyclopropane-fatty-acyl-phospholipid synthase
MTSNLDYQGASQQAIQRHYDVGNEFYSLWLDSTRTYSCALWAGADDTLQAAQERKLDFMATASRATGSSLVLDVGCGWGGLMRRLIERHGVDRVVGLTLSTAQAQFINEWSDARIDVRVENWIDHRPDSLYDAIISVGAFEHFADMGMTRDERVSAYRQFFSRCHEWLCPGARMALQTNVKGNNTRMDRQMVRDLLFVIDHVFPESELPWLSEIFQASEGLFDVVSLHNHPHHYQRTCREWHARLLANRSRAVELVGDQTVADYDRYLTAAVRAFAMRHLGLARVVFERV